MSWQKSPSDADPVNGQSRVEPSADATIERETFSQRIRTIVEHARTPITVSELAERLHATETVSDYGDIHDALYRDHLQTLDVEGALVFDMDVGLVYSMGGADDGRDDGNPAT